MILLASANDKHPKGLANRSDQVGRNFMYHQADALLAISTDRNEDSYTKRWGTNDFYLKDTDPAYPFPLGQVQTRIPAATDQPSQNGSWGASN